MLSDFKAEAKQNLIALSRNPYPGRGLVVGLNDSGTAVVHVYWIMGRSENSRNRVFGTNHRGRLYTEAADPRKMQDSSLIIYNAMRQADNCFVVSNGKQTDDVMERWIHSLDLTKALEGWKYEPDDPNFTPRITAVSWLPPRSQGFYQVSVLRRSRFGDGCDECLYTYEDRLPGFGHCVTTYMGDGNPLPSWSGEPRLMPLKGHIGQIARAYWAALNEKHRVSLAVKCIPLSSEISDMYIINKYEQA